jgi:hypothetical protein
LTLTRYRSIAEMPPPWREPSDPANLRTVARMLAFYRSLTRATPQRPGVQRFRTIEEANAARGDPYRA